MNSNYSWQKHQVNERIQTRLDEAESHRSLNRNNKEGENPSYTVGRILFLPVMGVAALMRRIVTHYRSNKPQFTQSV
jgi:hypothetical protein